MKAEPRIIRSSVTLGEWSVSRSPHFISKERATDIDWIESTRVYPKVSGLAGWIEK
jgi:hypothetical protein